MKITGTEQKTFSSHVFFSIGNLSFRNTASVLSNKTIAQIKVWNLILKKQLAFMATGYLISIDLLKKVVFSSTKNKNIMKENKCLIKKEKYKKIKLLN